MAGSQYCQPDDLYRYAVPPGSFPNPAREASADPATDILTLDGHGLRADDAITFRIEPGVIGAALPAPLVAGVTYYVIAQTPSTFKVAAAAGGAAIDLTSAGSRFVVVAALPFVEKIEMASAEVDELTGHATPLDAPYPVSVVAYTAIRAADLMLIHTGQAASVLGDEQRAIMREQRAAWRKGIPIRGAVVPAPANLAIKGSSSTEDPRGWVPSGGGIP